MLVEISDNRNVEELVKEGESLTIELSKVVGEFGKEAVLVAAIFSVFKDIKASYGRVTEKDL